MAERLEFPRSLYLPEAVEAAAGAFSELARVVVHAEEEGVRVDVSEPDPDLADCLADELANLALHETIVRTRTGE